VKLVDSVECWVGLVTLEERRNAIGGNKEERYSSK